MKKRETFDQFLEDLAGEPFLRTATYERLIDELKSRDEEARVWWEREGSYHG